MMQEVKVTRSDEAEHRDRTRDEPRPVHEPAEQDGVEGRDAGPEDEGPVVDRGQRQTDRLSVTQGRLPHAVTRRAAIDRTLTMPMNRIAASNSPRDDEADGEALVLALHDGVQRDGGADGGEAIDDVEEGSEADLAVSACRRGCSWDWSAWSQAATLPGWSWRRSAR